MVNISTEQLDAACAAYARATGSYPNRAGMRSALHTIDLQASLRNQDQTFRDEPGATEDFYL